MWSSWTGVCLGWLSCFVLQLFSPRGQVGVRVTPEILASPDQQHVGTGQRNISWLLQQPIRITRWSQQVITVAVRRTRHQDVGESRSDVRVGAQKIAQQHVVTVLEEFIQRPQAFLQLDVDRPVDEGYDGPEIQ